jgi:hypothetical protein
MIPAIASLFNPVSSIKGVSTVLNSIDSADTSGQEAESTSNPSKMMQSILQSLSSLPNSPTTKPAKDSGDSMPSFIESLLNAMQSQDNPSKLPNSSSASKNTFIGSDPLERGLQSLIDQVGKSSSTSSSTDLKQLEQSANQLFGAMGIPVGDQSLNQFLNTFKQSMSGNSPVGNILSTKA